MMPGKRDIPKTMQIVNEVKQVEEHCQLALVEQRDGMCSNNISKKQSVIFCISFISLHFYWNMPLPAIITFHGNENYVEGKK